MAITSKGYTGSVDNVDWSELTDKLGAQYAVFSADDFRVTAGSGDRALSVSPGQAAGQGILDTSDAAVTLSSSPVSGLDRWDLVALRRNWNTRTSTLVLLQGGAGATLPSTRRTTIGDIFDQPLALARFTAGQTFVQQFRDLRVWHGPGGLLANDTLALSFMDRLATTVRIGDVIWQRVLDSVGLPIWSPQHVGDTGWVVVAPADSTWSTVGDFGYSGLRVRRVGKVVRLEGVARRSGAIQDGHIAATLPAAFRPTLRVGVGTQRDQLEASVRPDGAVQLNGPGLPANTPVIFSGSWFID